MKKINRNIWLNSRELGDLEFRSAIAVDRHCRLGKYRSARKMKSCGGGLSGMMWVINLSDPAIDNEVRDRFYFKWIISTAMKEILQSEIKRVEEQICGFYKENHINIKILKRLFQKIKP